MEQINRNKMSSEIKNVSDFFNNGYIYHIPDYQRKYTWNSKQVKNLIDDIWKINRESNLFIGTIIIKTQNNGKENYLIDGQQRVTTFMLLFRALLDHIKEVNISVKEYELITDKLERFIYWEEEYKQKRLKINDLINGEKFRNLLESDPIKFSEIKKNKNTWCKKSLFHENYYSLREYIINDDIVVEKFIEKLNQVLINRIYLTQHESELKIFESINSKGTPLSSIDLIKNFYFILLRKFNINKESFSKEVKYFFEKELMDELMFERKNENKVFSSFIKKLIIYLQSKDSGGEKNKLPKESDEVELYNQFKYEMNKNFNSFETEEDITDSIKEIKRVLFTLKEIESYKNNDNVRLKYEEILKVFNSIFTGSQFFPVIMQLADKYFTYDKNQKITNKDDDNFGKSIIFLERFIVRRYASGLGSRLLTRTINNFRFNNYDEMVNIFEELEIPSDKQFEEAIKNNYIGDQVTSPIIRAILWRVETYDKTSKETLKNEKFENYTLEHIMPQTIDKIDYWKNMMGEEWKMHHNIYLNRLGNLTITRDNPALGNGTFNDKKIHYKESILSSNKELGKKDDWTKEEIVSRTNELVNKIMDIWK